MVLVNAAGFAVRRVTKVQRKSRNVRIHFISREIYIKNEVM